MCNKITDPKDRKKCEDIKNLFKCSDEKKSKETGIIVGWTFFGIVIFNSFIVLVLLVFRSKTGIIDKLRKLIPSRDRLKAIPKNVFESPFYVSTFTYL